LTPTFEGKRVLITGGTGSLGKVLVKRLLNGAHGVPASVTVFSRDEAKQHFMRLHYQQRTVATDEVIFRNFQQRLRFRIGDVRDYASLAAALCDTDIVFNAAALKQVPSCEYFPWEAVRTNVEGAHNIVRAISELGLPVQCVVGISTDKACKPVNVMGMTKALQERVFIQANLSCRKTRFVCARYGNVLASRGSVIPLFLEQIKHGGPVTITTPDMTRFLLTLEDAVDTIIAAVEHGEPGDTFIPRVPAARIVDIAQALIGDRPIKTEIVGVRPGEKIHESLISEEEATRTVTKESWYVVRPMLPELVASMPVSALDGEYSSDRDLLTSEQARELLLRNNLLSAAGIEEEQELLA